MRRLLLALVLLALAAPAAAEDESPLTPEQAADAVLVAFDAKDEAALRAFAEKDVPDPWLVADELCRRGSRDPASAFARAMPRVDTEALPGYVAGCRDRASDAGERERLRAIGAALAARRPDEVLAATRSLPDPLDSVVRVRLAHGRGTALGMLGRLEDGAEILSRAAEAAERLGWLRRADTLYGAAALSAWECSSWSLAHEACDKHIALARRCGDHRQADRVLMRVGVLLHARGESSQALSTLQSALERQERRADRPGMAATLSNIGVVHDALGEYPEALATLQRALEEQETIGDRVGAARTLGNIGSVHQSLGEFHRALAVHERALALKEALGDRRGAAYSRNGIGNALRRKGQYEQARASYERALAELKALGDQVGTAATLRNLGIVQESLGTYSEALATFEQALGLQQVLGSRAEAAKTLSSIGGLHGSMGDHRRALSYLDRALEEQEALGDRAGAALTLGNIAHVRVGLGEYQEALTIFRRVLEEQEALGDRAGAAYTLMGIGSVQDALGEYARALTTYERAHRQHAAVGSRAGAAKTLGNIGIVQCRLGDYEGAHASHERALAEKEALGDRGGAARTLSNIGEVQFRQRDYEGALASKRQAHRVQEEVGDRFGAARTLTGIGTALAALGRDAEALASYERALEKQEANGDRAGAAATLVCIGGLQVMLGRLREGRRLLERAIRAARALRDVATLVSGLQLLAHSHLEQGEPYRALVAARRALDASEGTLGGLAEGEGASARDRLSNIYAVGALAAARAEEPAEVLTFLEHGRAGALLDTLDKRETLRWKAATLPDELRRADEQAHAAERRARNEYHRALDGGDRREIRTRARALDAAVDEVRAAAARIQRDLKARADLFYPRAETLETIAMSLEPGQALVLYGLCRDEALAVVLEPDCERIVALGASGEVEAACEEARTALLSAKTRGPLAEGSETAPSSDGLDALDRLRRLLVDPLELLDDVTTVLVSPEGPLCYVPFGALFEGRNVATTPSGTTHVLLMDEEGRPGEGVLALGDPAYGANVDPGAAEVYRGGAKLTALPATRDEALAVGDVTLLGPDANEAALRDAIGKQKRWRAVHLACHGLVDPDRPMLSSLALTRAGEEDGFLTALEVLRMEIPADLAVLSACETAKGKIVKGEGIVGLTRAFMYAGAPRVLCSLWKVDDDATRALMEKFYQLWNPEGGAELTLSERSEPRGRDDKGLPAAEALRKAQAFVRGHEEWAHPYYWAAWVLWGLPE